MEFDDYLPQRLNQRPYHDSSDGGRFDRSDEHDNTRRQLEARSQGNRGVKVL